MKVILDFLCAGLIMIMIVTVYYVPYFMDDIHTIAKDLTRIADNLEKYQ